MARKLELLCCEAIGPPAESTRQVSCTEPNEVGFSNAERPGRGSPRNGGEGSEVAARPDPCIVTWLMGQKRRPVRKASISRKAGRSLGTLWGLFCALAGPGCPVRLIRELKLQFVVRSPPPSPRSQPQLQEILCTTFFSNVPHRIFLSLHKKRPLPICRIISRFTKPNPPSGSDGCV